jgi:RNA polymerase sigma factor (sigma-70 family)
MPRGQFHAVLRFLRTVAAGPADATDRQLLERFAAHRDGDAFAALLRRHGPMVLGVCRRVLNDPHDAEDAFQVTFLVLARKASALSRPELLGNWLFGVARRTALRARAAAAARRAVELSEVHDVPTPDPLTDLLWRDLRPVLDAEIDGLPVRYRAPFVLCYLEGLTYEEAARRLGCPLGTLSTRLTRARERLRVRLTRRGLALSSGVLAALLAQNVTTAAVPAALFDATAKAALLAAADQLAGAVSASVTSLMKGVLHAMFVQKLKTVAAVVFAVGVVTAGTGGVVLHRMGAAEKSNGPELAAQATRDRSSNRRGQNDVQGSQLRQENEQLKRDVQDLRKELDDLKQQFQALQRAGEKASGAKEGKARQRLSGDKEPVH